MSEVEAIHDLTIDAIEAMGRPFLIEAPEGRTLIAVPQENGQWRYDQITSANKAEVLMPKVVTQHVKMQTADSLVEYVNRFKNSDTMLFADIANDTIVSIVDYHNEPAALKGTGTDTKPTATLNSHRATLNLPKSIQWQTWTDGSDTLMTHREFATFLEENAVDIVSPRGADLLELCRDLQVLHNVNFSSSIRMGDVTELAYEKKSDATDKGGVSMPNAILLSIPVYFGESSVSIQAFMRRKIDDGKLLLGYSLSRAENVRQEEFHRIVDAVQIGVEHLTTVYGTPA